MLSPFSQLELFRFLNPNDQWQFPCPILLEMVGYYRRSEENSGRDKTNSITVQRTFTHSWASKNGFRIVAEFYDYESGGSTERQGLIDCLAYIERFKVTLLGVYKLDRLYRDITETLITLRSLKIMKCSFVCVTEDM
jgi:DNA invertase Pin-like site-specific DNA recombinase